MKPYQKINEAVQSTGLSAYYLRNGCKDGTIPHIRSGSVYYINVPALLQTLGTDDSATTSQKTIDASREEQR